MEEGDNDADSDDDEFEEAAQNPPKFDPSLLDEYNDDFDSDDADGGADDIEMQPNEVDDNVGDGEAEEDDVADEEDDDDGVDVTEEGDNEDVAQPDEMHGDHEAEVDDVVMHLDDEDDEAMDDEHEGEPEEEDPEFTLPPHRRAKGIEQLKRKGYSSLDFKLDPHVDRTGVFKDVDASKPLPFRTRVIGVDPGLKKLATYVSTEVLPGDDDVLHFQDLEIEGTFVGGYSTFDYQKHSQFLSHQEWERSRRSLNPIYGNWIKRMNEESLARPFHAESYVDAMYQDLDARVTELMSKKRAVRRFRRFSAHRATLVDIAKHIVYGDVMDVRPVDGYRTQKEEEKSRRRNKKFIRRAKQEDVTRIVCFGDGQYGTRGAGPCPRKKLISKIARLAPVLITNEFRTSMMHHVCGEKIQSTEGRVLTCGNNAGGAICQTGIDRDINGAANIGRRGLAMLRGQPPPEHLLDPRSKNKKKRKITSSSSRGRKRRKSE